jgi:hypothetical protein
MFKALLASLLTISLAAIALAQESPDAAQMPSGKDIINKSIEASGGRDAYEKVKSRVLEAKIDIPTMGITGTSTTYHEGQKVYTSADLKGAGTEQRGTDGEVYWEISTNTGPRIYQGAEREFWKRLFDMHSDLHLDKYYKSVETRGTADVGGKRAYKVVLVPHNGPEQTRYYDQESGLLVKADQTVPTPFGAIPTSSMYSDYRDVDGFKMPFKTNEMIAGQTEVVVTVEKIEHNTDIPDEKFELPEPINKLSQRQGGGSTTAPAAR